MQCARTWVALSPGPPPRTSSCALATDPSTLLTAPSSVDPLPSPSPWPTAMSMKAPARSSSLPGPKTTSELAKRHGGIRHFKHPALKQCYDCCYKNALAGYGTYICMDQQYPSGGLLVIHIVQVRTCERTGSVSVALGGCVTPKGRFPQ